MTISHEYAEELGRQIVELEAENTRLRSALQHAARHLSDLEYHYHGDVGALWEPIRAALRPQS